MDRTLQWLQGLRTELVPSAATPHIPEHHVVDNAMKMAQILLAGGPSTGETSDASESSPENTEDPPANNTEVSPETVEITVPAAPVKTKSKDAVFAQGQTAVGNTCCRK